jgi:phosphatidylglycerol:prolipoprotein diacylglycerol transferase
VGSVTPYGTALVAGFLTAWWLARRNARHAGIDTSHIDLLTPLSFAIGLFIAMSVSRFWTADLNLLDDGLVVHKRGRLLLIVAFSALAVFVYCRITSLRFRSLLDVFALPTILAVAILRIGCFVAGCCWGDIAIEIPDLPHEELALQVQTLPCLAGDWMVTAVAYPSGSFAFEQHLALALIEPGATESLPVHPVQLYEAVALLLLLVALHGITLDRFGPGTIAALAAGSYAVIRLLLEYLRADGTIVAWSMTLPQIQSLVLLGSVAFAVSMQTAMHRNWKGGSA